MNILLVGSGSREHALAWKFAKSPLLGKQYLWPGNPASKKLADSIDLAPDADFETLGKLVIELKIDVVICGPEQPLAEGLADSLQAIGIPVFGPVKEAAKLESSKYFAKAMMKEAGINTAEYSIAKSFEECKEQSYQCLEKTGGVVLKASGLAGGKGVFVCTNNSEIDSGLEMLYKSSMKSASDEVVVEQVLHGRECSYFTFVGEGTSSGLGFAVDFKRLSEDDKGPNTGGMGCYTPVPWLPENAADRVETEIVAPLLKTLSSKGIDYRGWLYVGVMWGESGPQVVEFNVRLGDPEAQILAVADDRDWLSLVAEKLGLADKFNLASQGSFAPDRKVVGVVMASEDYPYGGKDIESFELGDSVFQSLKGAETFAAAIKSVDDKIQTKSGRVLTVVAPSETYDLARKKAYEKIDFISGAFKKSQYRLDIAQKVAKEEK